MEFGDQERLLDLRRQRSEMMNEMKGLKERLENCERLRSLNGPSFPQPSSSYMQNSTSQAHSNFHTGSGSFRATDNFQPHSFGNRMNQNTSQSHANTVSAFPSFEGEYNRQSNFPSSIQQPYTCAPCYDEPPRLPPEPLKNLSEVRSCSDFAARNVLQN